MINRLEELLDEVEYAEADGEVMALQQSSGAAVRVETAAQTSSVELLSDTVKSTSPIQVTAQQNERDGAVHSPLLRELTYTGASSGLPELYRVLTRTNGLEQAAHSGAMAVVRETVAPPVVGLTAGELDLAMRRDSRRYDGGMTIY